LVFALGQLDFTYASALDRESIAAHMGGDPDDAIQILDYLEKHPWEAASLIWTLRVDGTWIYAVVPHGAFASEAYGRLRQVLREQVSEGVERISLAGALSGQVRTMSGEVLPVVAPQIRCLYSWTTGALLEQYEKIRQDSGQATVVRDFLERVYYGLRNLGLTAQDRALNYAVTNAMNVLKVFESALKDGMQLDTIETERSSLCRPESECCDVKLTFFKPKETSSARRVYRFTVDVSRACPVTVGDVRSWFVR
jgi:cyanobactin maturation PatA/PatG family protease